MKSPTLLAVAILSAAVSLSLSFSAPAQSTGNLVAPPLMLVKGAEQPIQLRSLAVNAQIDGGLARTTIQLTFHNPNARALEGELQFPLQPGQQVSGFALDIDGRMRPAVPVEKAKGQEVFEAVERRGVDPGLLEQTAGNQFRLRVYPIPANGERRVRIDIYQSLRREGGGWRFDLPLAFAGGADTFPMHVVAHGQNHAPRVVEGFGDIAFSRDGDGYATTIDPHASKVSRGLSLRFDAATMPQTFIQELDGQRYFHAEVPITGASATRAVPHTIGLLWDSSGSARLRDVNSELAVLDRYFAAVGTGEVRLTRLRDVAEPVRSFAIKDGDWSALRKELRATVYDGASALSDWKPQSDVQEYLLVSDGFLNYGVASEMPRLSQHQRMYTLDSAGANSDASRLAAWAGARGGRLVSWQGTDGVADATAQLLREGPRLLSIDGLGADGLVAASRFPQSGYLRIAGRLNQPNATITLHVEEFGSERQIVVPVAAAAPASEQVAALWASYFIAELAAEPELHRAQIHRLGSEFGLVTAETSLVVLENLNDYVRYDILPPAEYRDEVARLSAVRDAGIASARKQQVENVLKEFTEKVQWWETSWPKDLPAGSEPQSSHRTRHGSAYTTAVASSPQPAPPPAPMAEAPMATSDAISPPSPVTAEPPAKAANLDTIAVTGSHVRRVETESASPVLVRSRQEISRGGARVAEVAAAEPAPINDQGSNAKTNADIGIAVQSWKPDSPYAHRLREAKPDQIYAVYLDERDDHADSPAFYLDVADILFERGQRSLALRVLSNLAEMNLENRQVLRVLGYRLLQAHQAALAIRVFEHVSRLAEDEPQSWRDLGLAYAAAGRDQEAVDDLYRVVIGTWDRRFPSIELIALGELDAIAATAHKPLDTRAVDPRLLRNLPLDLRVVLSWDSDNTDLDLWVTDPNGEKTYYASPHSYQGGWLSHDCTNGYGPEEFILRHAKPGKYKIEVNLFGDHQQLVNGPTGFQVNLFTGFGTVRQKVQTVTMRVKDAKETALVGEFEVR